MTKKTLGVKIELLFMKLSEFTNNNVLCRNLENWPKKTPLPYGVPYGNAVIELLGVSDYLAAQEYLWEEGYEVVKEDLLPQISENGEQYFYIVLEL
jgi:hypothetical protein